MTTWVYRFGCGAGLFRRRRDVSYRLLGLFSDAGLLGAGAVVPIACYFVRSLSIVLSAKVLG